MAFTIAYGGESTHLLSATLRNLAKDNNEAGCDWYVEVVTHDGRNVAGRVLVLDKTDKTAHRVAILPVDADYAPIKGDPVSVLVDDIKCLEIP